MKFIFPQNYHFHTKLFGLLDYPTAILNFCWWIIMFLITKILPFPLLDKLIFFIITCFPLFLISLFGFQQENILYVFHYLFIFWKSNKQYLYKKDY